MDQRKPLVLRIIFLLTILVIALGTSCKPEIPHVIPITADGSGTSVFLPLIINGSGQPPVEAVDVPLIHIPFKDVTSFPSDAFAEMAIFWFGKVNNNDNYSDVRIGYNQSKLFFYVASFDRLLWYNASPTYGSITDWDAVSLYIQTSDENQLLTGSAFRLDSSLGPDGVIRLPYQASAVWNGNTWDSAALPYTTFTQWRGDGMNTADDDRGWNIIFEIPFSSLGFSSMPDQNTIWRLGVQVHDRDYLNGRIIESKFWPATFDTNASNGWGNISFGLVNSAPVPGTIEDNLTIREGLSNYIVEDASPGGYSTCGLGLNFWTEWGEKVYTGTDAYTAIIQNQRDIADWPCYSKYFVSFPLDTIPSNKTILSAKLTMHLYGNSGIWNDPVFQPYRSLIQVFVTDSNWLETTINWNNAPGPNENVSRTWVLPEPDFTGWPGVAYDWDLTYAIQKAYQNGDSTISLALYSADSAYHSGKYFSTSEVENWNAEARPTLNIEYGSPAQ
jgi:hypothetical protein